MHLIEVAFRGNRKQFFLWEGEESLAPRTAVIVEADRGEDLGHVHAAGEAASLRCTRCSHGCGTETPQQKVLRRATDDDERRAHELTSENESARRRAIQAVRTHGLVMKISDAEWQWDRRKLTFYFTAEKRVDFRALVRDLAGTFRTRIELKQIGVRDEAKRLSGIGRCGREYCSAAWLPELRPVSLQVAKDQKLSLNPSQISGACGRLMCCLRYEHDFYVQSRKRFPKEGKVIVTAHGEEKVLANDIFGERVTLRDAEGETRVVALAQLKREMEGRSSTPARTDAPPRPGTESDDEQSLTRGSAEISAQPSPSGGARSRRPPAASTPSAASSSPTSPSAGPAASPPSGREPSNQGAAGTQTSPSHPTAQDGSADTDAQRRSSGRTRRRGRRGGRRSRPSGERPRNLPPEQ
ncbi:MAG TPA: regulatory iron-sulfur-containing complex subunit RicT [Gemmatimonadaceae bacterium]|nr:regulatory iron-sulfur-containing complex subunit RicT [Gemmatimonadaceae bacterium]